MISATELSKTREILALLEPAEMVATKYVLEKPADVPYQPADWLEDAAWFEARLAEHAGRWGSDDPKVNAAITAFTISHTLLGSAIFPYLVSGQAFRVSPDRTWLAPNGYVGGMEVQGVHSLAAALDDIAHWANRYVATMSKVSGYSSHHLRMLIGDGIGMSCNAALRLGLTTQERAREVTIEACEIFAGYGFCKPPKFVQIVGDQMLPLDDDEPIAPDGRMFVLRASCCQIYRGVDHGKCVLCPRQKADVIQQRLLAHLAELEK